MIVNFNLKHFSLWSMGIITAYVTCSVIGFATVDLRLQQMNSKANVVCRERVLEIMCSKLGNTFTLLSYLLPSSLASQVSI
jgi:hypothetical protein